MLHRSLLADAVADTLGEEVRLTLSGLSPVMARAVVIRKQVEFSEYGARADGVMVKVVRAELPSTVAPQIGDVVEIQDDLLNPLSTWIAHRIQSEPDAGDRLWWKLDVARVE